MKRSELKTLIKEVLTEELDDIRKGLLLVLEKNQSNQSSNLKESRIAPNRQQSHQIKKHFTKDRKLNQVLMETQNNIVSGKTNPITEGNVNRPLDTDRLPQSQKEFADKLMNQDFSKILKESLKHKK